MNIGEISVGFLFGFVFDNPSTIHLSTRPIASLRQLDQTREIDFDSDPIPISRIAQLMLAMFSAHHAEVSVT